MPVINEENQKLSGQISDFPLTEVIQFLGMTQKSGALQVYTKENKAPEVALFFKGGNLVHAARNGSSGAGVFFKLLERKDNTYFKFIKDQSAPTTTIDKPVHIMLLESQNRQDELNHLNTKLPADNSVLFLVPKIAKVPAINTFEWRILALINGRNTIRRLCEKIGDEWAVKKIIYNLYQKGLIRHGASSSQWDELVPQRIPSGEMASDPPYPPLLRTNLLLKAIDGSTSLRVLRENLNMSEVDLEEDIKLLHDSHWIRFSTGQEEIFSQLRLEI